jgi:hypothetical protein
VVGTMDVKNNRKDPIRIASVRAMDQNGAMLNLVWSAAQREMGGVPAELITQDWVLEDSGAGLPDARQIRAQMEQETGFRWGTPLQTTTIVRQEGLFRSDVSVHPMERIIPAGSEIEPVSSSLWFQDSQGK